MQVDGVFFLYEVWKLSRPVHEYLSQKNLSSVHKKYTNNSYSGSNSKINTNGTAFCVLELPCYPFKPLYLPIMH